MTIGDVDNTKKKKKIVRELGHTLRIPRISYSQDGSEAPSSMVQWLVTIATRFFSSKEVYLSSFRQTFTGKTKEGSDCLSIDYSWAQNCLTRSK